MRIVMRMSIIFPLRNNRKEILMATKKPNAKVGANMLFVYGGLLEPKDASMEHCAQRELAEECNLQIQLENLIEVGEMTFHRFKKDGVAVTSICKLYFIEEWEGEPESSDEMRNPSWCLIHKLPYTETVKVEVNGEVCEQRAMMQDCLLWMPILLQEGKTIIGEVVYNWEGEVSRSRVFFTGSIPTKI